MENQEKGQCPCCGSEDVQPCSSARRTKGYQVLGIDLPAERKPCGGVPLLTKVRDCSRSGNLKQAQFSPR